jgi:hypothetical protein
MENTVMDTKQVESPAENTESNTADNTEQETVDPWSVEEFDINTMKPAEENPQDEPADNSNNGEVNLEDLYRQQIASEDAKLDKPILVKYKGKVVDIDDVNELRDMAERSIAATIKLQEAAELRKQYEGITPEDIELLRRFKGGDTSVINDLAVDRAADQPTEVDTIASEILAAPYAEQFKGFVDVLNPADRQMLASDPRVLRGLQIDFENGTATKLMPLVERKMAINGKDFLTAYKEAGQEVMKHGDTRKQSVEQLTAAPQANTSVKQQPKQDVWSMDSSTFKKLFNNEARR